MALKKSVKILLILIVLIAITLGAGVGFYFYSLSAVSDSTEEYVFEVLEGDSTQDILKRLQEDGLIRSAFSGNVYARLNNIGDQYIGDFQISASMSTPEILAYLSDPANIDTGYEVITFREGLWAKEMAQLLSDNFLDYSFQSFLNLWNDPDYINDLAKVYDFIHPDQISSEVNVLLEGYLYPETYYFDTDATEQEITEMFLNQFQEVYNSLKDEIDKSDLSLEQILTLASIVEYESGDPEYMDDVAEVFYNRLDRGMKLESSVTVCYALYDELEDYQDCELNADIDSPYNTYLIAGLPAGPILNPSKDAIEAVLNPADHDYLYFVSDIYGDGALHFAETYEEHLENINRYNLSIE